MKQGFALLGAVLSLALFFPIPRAALDMHFLSVGHGDAIVLRTKMGDTIVVDAGDRETGKQVRAFLQLRGWSIDYLFITHPHPDHVGGAVYLLDLLKLKAIHSPWDDFAEPLYADLLSRMAAKDIQQVKVLKGWSYRLAPDILIEVVHPDGKPFANINDRSLVLRVCRGDQVLLLAGDVNTAAQQYLVETCPGKLRAQILKFPHHGSPYSLNKVFYMLVDPEIVVVSTGKSKYNYPDAGVMRFLATSGARLLRTDRDGDVHLSWPIR